MKILSQDLDQARRVAERIPRDGKRRQLGDCLIGAMALHLNYDVVTLDRRFGR